MKLRHSCKLLLIERERVNMILALVLPTKSWRYVDSKGFPSSSFLSRYPYPQGETPIFIREAPLLYKGGRFHTLTSTNETTFAITII